MEANGYDKHWAVGVGLRDSNLQNKKAWVGKNLLGKLLDKMRKHLKSNDDRAYINVSLVYVLNIYIICNNIHITKTHLICNIFTDIMHMYMHIVSRRYNTEIA